MTDRRGFLSALAGLGSALLVSKGALASAAPRVSASTTVFFGPPDGRNTLVRFTVENSDAPAARLRVFDRAHRQLGTAGVIGVSGRMYGELWLPLDRATDITTELEIRGAGIVRTTHRLVPRRKWTLYWLPAANTLGPGAGDAEFLDHLEFLQIGAGAPAGAVVLDATRLLERVATAPMMLAGSGIQWVGRSDAPEPVARIESRDGSAVVALAVAGTGVGLGAGRSDMARGIENWLEGPGALIANEARSVALIVGTAEEETAMNTRLADWNARFAYPRLLTEQPAELLALAEQRAVRIDTSDRATRPPASTRWQRRTEDSALRAARAFEPLVSRLPDSGAGLTALAAQFAFTAPATLVVNPTPFPASGLATMPDGSERVVRDVPAFGYLCEPYAGRVQPAHPAGAGWWMAVLGSDNDLTLDARHFQVRIDLETGAIRSLVSRANGREWVRRGGLWNSAEGARLESVQKFTNAGVGLRMTIGRRLAAGGMVSSAVTIYDDLPWIDIVNRRAGGSEPYEYGFSLAVEQPELSWEVPGGFERRQGPVERLAHLRWLRVAAGSDAVLLRGLDAPLVSIAAEAEVRSLAPAESGYRIGVASGFSAPEDPWAFGWGSESLHAVPVPGTGRARLASFGSLLVLDQAGACILDLRRDPAGEGVMTHVQELTGRARDITLGPGVLAFKGARRIDFAGRDLGELPLLAGGGTAVPVKAYGITAVRLTGVELAAG